VNTENEDEIFRSWAVPYWFPEYGARKPLLEPYSVGDVLTLIISHVGFNPKDSKHILLGNEEGLYEEATGRRPIWDHMNTGDAFISQFFYSIMTDNA